MSHDVQTWRARIGAGPDFPMRTPCAIERAIEAEIAELRATVLFAPARAAAVDNESNQMLVVGGQRINKQALLSLQRDAARYRWLRDDADSMLCKAAPMVVALDANGNKGALLDGEELDAAVDLAMTPRAARWAAKLKRMENTQ